MSSIQRRRQLTLDAFEKHEEMLTLFDCLARAPSFDGSKVDEGQDAKTCARLVDDGLLVEDAGWCVTSAAGRAALIAYINGDEDSDDDEDSVRVPFFNFNLTNEQGDE